MSLLEIIALGYILNILLMVIWVVYAVIKVLITIAPEQLVFGLDGLENKRSKTRGIWIFPFASILEIMILIKKEIDFNVSHPNKTFMDFLETLMEDI